MLQGFSLGSVRQDARTGLKNIFATPAVDHYMSLESPGGADYQVPVGKVFIITRLFLSVTTAGGGVRVGYGSAGVPDQVGAPAGDNIMSALYYVEVAKRDVVKDVYIEVPANQYPYAYASGSAGFINVQGVEVTA